MYPGVAGSIAYRYQASALPAEPSAAAARPTIPLAADAGTFQQRKRRPITAEERDEVIH